MENESNELSVEKLHYYLIAGGIVKITDQVKLKPSSLLKITQAAPIEADFTTSFLFKNKFLLGIMYRTGDALGALAGMNVTEQLYLGYSFDWSFVNTTSKYNDGSHEIVFAEIFLIRVKN